MYYLYPNVLLDLLPPQENFKAPQGNTDILSCTLVDWTTMGPDREFKELSLIINSPTNFSFSPHRLIPPSQEVGANLTGVLDKQLKPNGIPEPRPGQAEARVRKHQRAGVSCVLRSAKSMSK